MSIYQDLDEAKKISSAIEQKLIQAGTEHEALIQAGDPFGAEKKKQEAASFIDKLEYMGGEQEKLQGILESDIKDGKYLTYGIGDPNADISFSEESIKAKTAEALSKLVDGEVDVTSGFPAGERAKLSLLQGQSQDDYLAQTYGPENVRTFNVSGKPTRLVKNQSGKWTAINEIGGSLGDALSLSGEVIPLIGSVLGSFGGGVLTPMSPAGIAVGGAAGYTAAGTLQDQLVKSVLGAGDGFADSLGKRSAGGLLGAGLEFGASVLARPIMRKMGKGKIDEYYQDLKKSEEYLKSRGHTMDVAQLVQGGNIKNDKWIKLSQARPGSAVANDIRIGVERLGRIRSDLPTVDKSAALYSDTISNIRSSNAMTADMVSLYNKEAGDIIRRDMANQVQELKIGQYQDTHDLGQRLFDAYKQAENKSNIIKNEVYTPFYQKANQAISVNADELADVVEKEYFGTVNRTAELDLTLKELRDRPSNAKRIEEIKANISNTTDPAEIAKLQREAARLDQLSGNLNAKQLDDYIRRFREAAPDQGVVGASLPKQVAGKSAGTVQKFRDDLYSEAKLMDEWNNATSVFNQRMGFERGSIGSYLKESFGTPNMDQTKMVNSILESPRNIGDAISALRVGDPSTALALTESLKTAYFKKIGLSNLSGREVDSFSFDEDIVRSLFGFNGAGVPNPEYGNAMIQKLYSLQNTVKAKGLDSSKLTMDDVNGLSGVLSRSSVDDMTRNISNRIKSEMELDKVKQNALMGIAMKGHREAIQSGEFPKALWNSNPSDARKALDMMPPEERKVLAGDMVEHLFSQYPPSGKHGIHGEELWDGKKLLSSFSKNPNRERVMRATIGDPEVDDIIAASKLMSAVENAPVPKGKAGGGGVINDAGFKWYLPVQAIYSGVSNSVMGSLYRAGKMAPFLRQIGRKELTQEEYKKTISKTMLGLMKTGQGIEAMTQSGRYNPEWGAWMGKNLGLTSEQTQDYQEKYGAE